MSLEVKRNRPQQKDIAARNRAGPANEQSAEGLAFSEGSNEKTHNDLPSGVAFNFPQTSLSTARQSFLETRANTTRLPFTNMNIFNFLLAVLGLLTVSLAGDLSKGHDKKCQEGSTLCYKLGVDTVEVYDKGKYASLDVSR
ncbi:hypothetical protein EK21DRAFT_114578 [Setomelanomma holmii]|uniref:Uncharacterized protein n=1 Tax=Setomelanomma holmii TaxID=210430 RepID=A0A9P4H3Q1_9PLEO|nr:hypothetical protein EK21DRAFT_114578 [Setomelanomma holmii]